MGVCESIMPNGEDCPGKPEYFADRCLIYCRGCMKAMLEQFGYPGTIYKELPDGTTAEANMEELMK